MNCIPNRWISDRKHNFQSGVCLKLKTALVCISGSVPRINIFFVLTDRKRLRQPTSFEFPQNFSHLQVRQTKIQWQNLTIKLLETYNINSGCVDCFIELEDTVQKLVSR